MKNYNQLITQSILKHSDIIMVTLDRNYNYITFSEKYKQLIKHLWDTDIKVGESIFDIIKEDDNKKRFQYNFEKALQGNSFTLSEELIHNKLQSTHWENHYIPLYENNKIIGVTIIINDLTYLVNTSKNFNKIKIFEKIVDLVDVGVLIIDFLKLHSSIIYSNHHFSKITGYTKDDLKDENATFFLSKHISKSDLKIILESIKNYKSCEIVTKYSKKDLSSLTAYINITPILDEDKNPLYFAAVVIDITKISKIKKLEMIKKLSSGLTHELNTAITSINGNIEMLGYDINALSNQTVKQNMSNYLKNISKGQKVISGITNSLHFLNSIPSIIHNKINIISILITVAEEFRSKLDENNIQLNINNKSMKILFPIEEKILFHLWSIFLDNSIDSLVMKKGLRTINIDIYESKEKIYISITDNGIGIPKSIQDEIFQPLVKGKKFGGIGMGLFNAKNIIETYNGVLSFSSDDQETIFYIVFTKTTY